MKIAVFCQDKNRQIRQQIAQISKNPCARPASPRGTVGSIQPRCPNTRQPSRPRRKARPNSGMRQSRRRGADCATWRSRCKRPNSQRFRRWRDRSISCKKHYQGIYSAQEFFLFFLSWLLLAIFVPSVGWHDCCYILAM